MRLRALAVATAAALILPVGAAVADEAPSPTLSVTADPTPEPTAPPSDTTTPEPSETPTTDPTSDPTGPAATESPTETPTDPTQTPTTDPTDPPAAQAEVRFTSPTVTLRTGSTFTVGVRLEDTTDFPAQIVAHWSLGGVNDDATVDLDATGAGSFVATVPAGVADGTYRVGGFATTVDGVTPYAPAQPVEPSTITIDNTSPAVTVKSTYGTFYPYPDKYRDSTTITLTSAELSHYSLTLWKDGKSVRTLGSLAATTFQGSKTFTWDGTIAGKRSYGTFTIKARAADALGNLTEKNLTVATSSKHLQWRTWTATAPAWDLVTSRDVGSCSSVSHPARSGWPHSVAYHSLTRCRTASQGYATTESGAYIHSSFDGTFRNLHVDAYGGRPQGWSGKTYMISYYENTSGTLVRGHQVGTSTQWKNQGTVADPKTLVYDPKSAKPYFYWMNGLDDGARYDIRSFRITVDYKVLA